MENSNVNEADADNNILKLSHLESVIEEISSNWETYRTETTEETNYFDTLFENEVKNIVNECDEAYNQLLMRTVVIKGFYKMLSIREEYFNSCGKGGPN